MVTFVLAEELAFANTSAKCALSDADKPNAVNASVTMSDVVAKSSPSAAARFIMPSMPSIMSCVFQPAIAMYWNASADSVALNLVLAPISLALSFNVSKSLPVAPDIADTLLIEDSKSALVLTTAVPRPTTGAVTAVVRVLPAVARLLPTPWILLPIVVTMFLVALSASLWADFNPAKKPDMSRSK